MKRVLITLAVDLPVKDASDATKLINHLIDDVKLPWENSIEVLEVKILNQENTN